MPLPALSIPHSITAIAIALLFRPARSFHTPASIPLYIRYVVHPLAPSGDLLTCYRRTGTSRPHSCFVSLVHFGLICNRNEYAHIMCHRSRTSIRFTKISDRSPRCTSGCAPKLDFEDASLRLDYTTSMRRRIQGTSGKYYSIGLVRSGRKCIASYTLFIQNGPHSGECSSPAPITSRLLPPAP